MVTNKRLHRIIQEEITKSDEKRIKEIVADSVKELFHSLWVKNNVWLADVKK